MSTHTHADARRLVITAAALASTLSFGGTVASAQDQTPPSQMPGQVPMDQINLQGAQPGQVMVPAPGKIEDRSPFIHDAKLSFQIRSFYFYRDKYDDSLSEAWALGGSASFKSGYFKDFLSIGAVGYTSQKLYGPDDRDGTLLLGPGQDGYFVLGQIYTEFKFTDRIFAAIGRKEYDTPFMNKNDVRMTPNTFEGATIYGKAGGTDGMPNIRFGGGYISRIKERNSQDFEWMSMDAGSDAERGIFVLGANFDWGRFSIGAIDYYCQDVINIFYTECKYTFVEQDDMKWTGAAQFTDQRNAAGEERLTGEEFSTSQLGVKTELKLGAALFTLGYTYTAEEQDMISPWGGYPGYTSVQVEDFNRAGESAFIGKVFYDLTDHGLKGVSAYGLWVHGEGRQDTGSDQDEFDANLQWKVSDGVLAGTSFRVRYAYVMQHGDDDSDLHDFRFIVNYDFPNP